MEKEITVQFFTPLDILGITYLKSSNGRVWVIDVVLGNNATLIGDIVIVQTEGGYKFKGKVNDIVNFGDADITSVEIQEILNL